MIAKLRALFTRKPAQPNLYPAARFEVLQGTRFAYLVDHKHEIGYVFRTIETAARALDLIPNGILAELIGTRTDYLAATR